MIPVSRMYATESQARAAAERLVEEVSPDWATHLIAPPAAAAPSASAYSDTEGGEAAPAPPAPSSSAPAPTPEELIEMVRTSGDLPRSRAVAYSKGLANGNYLVVGRARYGGDAAAILDSFEPLDPGGLPLVPERNPDPFSRFIGFPTLEKTGGMTFMSPFGNPLTRSTWTFSSLLGLPLLSSNPAPLSSMIGMKPLSAEKPWKTSFGLPLLTNQRKD